MSGRLRRTWGQRAVLTVNTFAIVAALGLAWALDTGEELASSISRVELSDSLSPVEPDEAGGAPPLNVLLVGYDSAANLDPDDPIAIGRQGERLADVIIIARIDQDEGSAQLLSIPRDLWVTVPGHGEQKINSSFQIGGPSLLIETIEAQFGIPINNFASVDLAGFEGLVDVVDHVDLQFGYPSRDFNPAPASGPPRSMTGFVVESAGCQALDPPNALAFVRSRNFQVLIDGDWTDDGERSDLERIRRQQLFVESFIARAIDLGARNPLVLRELVTAAVPHLTLDQEMTPQELIDLGRAFDSFDADELESYSLPTEFGWERNRTLSVVRTLEDESAPLVRLFQGVPADAPSTVGVTVFAVVDAWDSGSDVSAALEAGGFDVGPPEVASDGLPGITVSFGQDGATALPIVESALAAEGLDIGQVVLDPALPGREIHVLLGQPEPEVTSSTEAPTPTTTPTTTPVTTAAPAAPTTLVTEGSVPLVANGDPEQISSATGPSVQRCS